MPKSNLTILSAVIGLTLSTALAGCATRAPRKPPPAAPTVHAVKVGDPTPPANLLLCPAPVDGFPLDQVATLPPPVRDAVIRLARALAANTGQLRSLIDFHQPGTCP